MGRCTCLKYSALGNTSKHVERKKKAEATLSDASRNFDSHKISTFSKMSEIIEEKLVEIAIAHSL